MTYRALAIACLILAAVGLITLLAVPAHAHPGHKVGPVCTVKQAAKHPKKCIVVKVPTGTPMLAVAVQPGYSAK